MQNRISTWETFKGLIQTPELPDIGPTPRASRLPSTALNRKVEGFVQETKLSPALQPLVRSAALLWHDYLDESHAISQDIHNTDGSFLHGIMHRREPDYSNAKYWFHRAGEHVCFPEIAKQVTRLVDSKREKDLRSRLAPRGDWDACAFVDLCQEQAGRPSSDHRVQTLKAIQEIEFDSLLAHLLAG